MQRIRFKSLASTLVILIMASFYPLQVNAQEESSLVNYQNELQQLQANQNNLNSTLQNTLNNARSMELEVSNQMMQSRALKQQIDKKKEQINVLNTQFKTRLKVMYENGDVSFLQVLFASKGFNDFLDRFNMLTLIAKQDQTLVNKLHNENALLEKDQNQLSEQLKENESKQEQLLALENNLQQQLTSNNKQIATTENNIQTQEQLQSQASKSQHELLASRGESILSVASSTNAAASIPASAPYLEMVATAYTAAPSAHTATGTQVSSGTVAVDPQVIPLGSKLYIEGYGYATATDTGLDIKGNRIDLFFTSVDQCLLFGRRTVKVYRLS